MCLAIPQKVIKVTRNYAFLVGGQKVNFKIAKVKVGDYVITKDGLVIRIVPPKTADEIFKLINE